MLVYIDPYCSTFSFPIKKIAPYTFIESTVRSIKCMPEEIGEKSFAHSTSLKEINLTLCKNIGKKAFIYSGIQYIEIPPFVTEIKESTFSESNLSTIKFLGDSQLKKIGISAFKKSKIKSIEIPKGVTEIAETAFAYCKELQEIKFSENSELVIIKEDAFEQSSIRSITIPKKVKKICANAFYYCRFLEMVTFSDDSALEIIGSQAFLGTKIKAITIPPHVKELSDSAFSSCEQLKIIEFPDNSELQVIKQCALVGTIIESITIPAGVIKINKRFLDGETIKKINIQKGNKYFKILDDSFIIRKPDPKSLDFDCLVYTLPTIKNAIIPPFIKTIEPFAFDNSMVEYVKFPPNITRIYKKTFIRCKKLKTIEFDINSKLRLIDSEAFLICPSIEKVILPSSVETLKNGWIYSTNINDVQLIGNSLNLKIENKIIFGKTDIKSDLYDIIYFVVQDVMKTFTIPPNIKKISLWSFTKHAIETIIIPPSVTEISDYAFYKCEKLEKVEMSDNSQLKKIGTSSFQETNIKSIQIPKHVTEIGQLCFGYCKNLTKCEFLENSELEIIGKFAFTESSIEYIKIPPLVTKICYGTFIDCSNLSHVDFQGDSLRIIDSNAFTNTNIEYITFPTSLLSISNDAFCFNSKTIYIYTFNNEKLKNILSCLTIYSKIFMIDEKIDPSDLQNKVMNSSKEEEEEEDLSDSS